MTIETQTIVNLLAQIPLVGIFVWFVLKTGEREQTAQDKRDEQWRDFLRGQREANNAAIARLAEEIKVNGKQISAQTQVLDRLVEKVGATNEK